MSISIFIFLAVTSGFLAGFFLGQLLETVAERARRAEFKRCVREATRETVRNLQRAQLERLLNRRRPSGGGEPIEDTGLAHSPAAKPEFIQ